GDGRAGRTLAAGDGRGRSYVRGEGDGVIRAGRRGVGIARGIGHSAGKDRGDDIAIVGHPTDGDAVGRRSARDDSRRGAGRTGEGDALWAGPGDGLATGDSEDDRAPA